MPELLLRGDEMAGDLDLSRRAQDVDEHKLALAMAHAGMNCGKGAAAGDDADLLALSEHAPRGLWVSKRVLSRYRSGTSRNWLKCLNPDFQRR
jgi:hypothetical protein